MKNFDLKEAQAAWVAAWVSDRDEHAFELLMQSVETLVFIEIRRARKHSKTIDAEDLKQEAKLGVMRAAERFDPSVGAIFGSYARWYIREWILNAAIASDTQTSIKRSSKDHRIHTRVRGIVAEAQDAGLSVSQGLDIAADCLEITRQHADRAFGAYQRISIGSPVGGDEDGEEFEVLSDAPSAAEEMDTARLPGIVAEIMAEACDGDERAAWIVRERHWGADGEGRSYQDMGDELGISRERVRGVYARALARMAELLSERGLGLDELLG